VNWTYVGDAFPLDGGDLPAWIDPTAAFWAAGRRLLQRDGPYYLLTTVTETTAAGGGSDTCRGDSAIGVAVGDSPTGPWVWSDPAGRPAADRPQLRHRRERMPRYFWTFDPDVLGDTVTNEGILYYGSYYGGMFVTDVSSRDRRDGGDRSHHGRHHDRHRQPLRGRQRRLQGRLLLPVASATTAATAR
jgi:arabinan endo-1,5-alpha-L-arabinosidase